MRWAIVGAALAGVLAVSGCTADRMPRDPAPDEIAAVMLETEQQVWSLQWPGEIMPYVAPIRTVEGYDEQNGAVALCLDALRIPGFELDAGFTSWSYTPTDQAALNVLEQAHWSCRQQYPIDPASPDVSFVLSRSQAEYLYAYYEARLIPCLEAHGIDLVGVMSRDQFLATPWAWWSWSPYAAVFPVPVDAAALRELQALCERPPVSLPIMAYGTG